MSHPELVESRFNSGLHSAELAQIPEDVLAAEGRIYEQFLSQATGKPEKGYITFKPINHITPPGLLIDSAKVIAFDMSRKGIRPQEIAGISHFGIPLATAVGILTETPISIIRKGSKPPGSWPEPFIVEDVASYTSGVGVKNDFAIYNSGHTDRAIIDDYLNDAKTSEAILRTMMERGINPYFAAFCAKLFREGVGKLEEIGVKPFYIIGVERIEPDGKIVLAPAMLSGIDYQAQF